MTDNRIVSVQFYKDREYCFDRLLRKGDTVVDIEFNTDTQLYDVMVKSEDMEVVYYGSPETGYGPSVRLKKDD
jgi:hypothetical protein